MRSKNSYNFISANGGTSQIYLHEPRSDSEPIKASRAAAQSALFACALAVIIANVKAQIRNKKDEQTEVTRET